MELNCKFFWRKPQTGASEPTSVIEGFKLDKLLFQKLRTSTVDFSTQGEPTIEAEGSLAEASDLQWLHCYEVAVGVPRDFQLSIKDFPSTSTEGGWLLSSGGVLVSSSLDKIKGSPKRVFSFLVPFIAEAKRRRAMEVKEETPRKESNLTEWKDSLNQHRDMLAGELARVKKTLTTLALIEFYEG